VIASTGEKRIGFGAQVDDKVGCTVLLMMDMWTSHLLRRLVIFSGVFGNEEVAIIFG